jgi:hypothetical protein
MRYSASIFTGALRIASSRGLGLSGVDRLRDVERLREAARS